MENLIFGLASVGSQLKLFFHILVFHPTTIGFVAGFLAATSIYLFILFEEKGHVVAILLHRAPESCYRKLSERAPKGTLEIPYADFIHMYNQVRVLFYSAATVFLLALVLILARAE